MSRTNWNTNKIGENLSIFLERFLNFADNAVPSPEIEIRIKDSAREFYEKYLMNDERYYILYIENKNIFKVKFILLKPCLFFNGTKYVSNNV